MAPLVKDANAKSPKATIQPRSTQLVVAYAPTATRYAKPLSANAITANEVATTAIGTRCLRVRASTTRQATTRAMSEAG